MRYVTQKTQQIMHTGLAGEDRMSFNQIARSKFIRQTLRDKKFIAHSSPTTIRSKVYEYFYSAKVFAIEELTKMKSNGDRMVLNFNEWTRKNRRYLTVNVWGSQKAEANLELVTKRAGEFVLPPKDDIVAMVTDGASLTMKLGRIAPVEHIVSLIHTLYLVITNVLYKKKAKPSADDSNEV